jgi:hypothetical protein
MSRKAPSISYDALNIGPVSERTPAAATAPVAAPMGGPKVARTMRDESAPVTLYLHPAARKALKRYAFEQEVKVHDLLLEAVEDWFRSHGLREQVRVARSSGPA